MASRDFSHSFFPDFYHLAAFSLRGQVFQRKINMFNQTKKPATSAKATAPVEEAPKSSKKQGLVYTHPKSMRWSPGSKTFWAAVIALVVSAVVFGGGIYFFQDYFYSHKIDTLNKQIKTLTEQVNILIPLAGLRSEDEISGIVSCPPLKISDDKATIMGAGSPMGFTQVPTGEELQWEIVDVIAEENCSRFAWSVIGLNPTDGSGVSRVYIAEFDGTSVDIEDLYDKPLLIDLERLDSNSLVFSYDVAGRVPGAWYEELAKPTALLNIRTGKIDEWGQVYAFSSDLTHLIIARNGRDIMIDADDRDEVAVLSQNGTDEAIDYTFSPDGTAVAYLFFSGQESQDFLKDYTELCQRSPVSAAIRIWNLRTRQLSTLQTQVVPGMRLVSWDEDGILKYTSLVPVPKEQSIILP